MEKSLGILVLESPWSEDLSDGKSVRPFIQGWAELRDIELSYRMYHNQPDLSLWLESFMCDPDLRVCYIAGHGQGGRLCGLTKNINLSTIAAATNKKGRVGTNNKGILLGACKVGANLKGFLNKCGSHIIWVAGYDRPIPWMESTICDLLFLEYIMIGRSKRNKQGAFLMRNGDFIPQKTKYAKVAKNWVRRDCKLAVRCGFKARDRGR